MKNKLTPVVLVALFLFLSVPNVNSSATPVDNTTSFTGFFAVVNPCNGENVQGPIDVHIVVTDAETGNGKVKVNVHHTSHGTLAGSLGNEYQVSRQAKGKFDAIATQYVIDWSGQFIGKGAAPDFTAQGTLRVFTNAENEPLGSNLVSMTTACK